MTKLTHVATHVSKKAQYSTNITDLTVIDGPQGMVLVAVSNKGAGLISYMLTGADTPARGVTRESPISYGTYYAAPKLEVIGDGNAYRIVISGQHGSVHSGLLMTADGNLKSFTSLFAPAQIAGDVVAMKVFSVAGQEYVLAARDGDLSLLLYRLDDGFSLHPVGSAGPGGNRAIDSEYTDIEVISEGGTSYAYATSAQGDLLAVYQIGPDGIDLHSVIDGAAEIGIAAPRAVEAVTTANGRFLIVTGGTSDSLSVFRISASGGLSLADHVVDSALTRFQAATAIATVELDGRAFIFVGGADDGISVLTLDGHGRLILLEVLADTAALALADISAIEAVAIGDGIALFVASATETGITQLFFDPGRIGLSLVGSGRVAGSAAGDILVGIGTSSVISGGEGDDILIAREGTVIMRGGAGADIFVPGHGATMVTIDDFDPRIDRLDLSELAYIRSTAQLRVIPTATGAILVAGEVRIEIRTASGSTMTAADFTNEMFRLAHYANDIDYTRLVTPVVPEEVAPSFPSPGSGDSGGYVGPTPLPPMTAGANPLLGTSGADKIVMPATGGAANGLAGDDVIIGALKVGNHLLGGPGNDILQGGDLGDNIDGGPGNDLIMGGGGNDQLSGGDGNDTIHGGDGDDRIHGGSGADRLVGGPGNDVIYGLSGGSVMLGGEGHDLIQGLGGRDTILGGPGNDRLYGGKSNNWIYGGDGNDLIRGETRNLLFGENGNDTIFGGTERDYIYGGAGDDLMYGRGGDDFMIAHDGNDTMFGGDGNDHLIGNAGNDMIYGGDGDDLLWGVEGDDFISGQEGNDSIRGGDGRDTLIGGPGNDKILGGADNDIMQGDSGDDYMHGQEGNDTIEGGTGRDTLIGGPGNDLLDGGADDDLLTGSGGNDLMRGGAGNDSLDGGPGNDTLEGGEGADTLTGGSGEDVFVFTPPPPGTTETDVITDFRAGEDLIDLSAISDALIWIGGATLTGSGRSEVAIREYATNTCLTVDIDGDGNGDLHINIFGDVVSPFDLLF